MQKIARFEKVSYEQFRVDWIDCFGETEDTRIREIYDNIKLPKRGTVGSAGYDFYAPISFTLNPGEQIKVPTGVRVWIDEGWVLCIFPRSSWGFKYRLQLNNTVGIIDSDYYGARNEGHMFCKLTNDTKDGKSVTIEQGVGMTQGIFMPYGITVDDECETERHGGFGSTNG